MKELFSHENDRVSFEEFMTYALHHPLHGYYAQKIFTVGRGGDFTTTAEISPALAKAIADWLMRHLRATNCRHVIELGPGSGALAAAVRKQLPWYWRWRTQWHLVESSASLRALQQQHPPLWRARWHDTVEDALASCEGAACLYSNEFFDAFPVRLFQREAEQWQEVFVNERLSECFELPQSLPESSTWSRSWPQAQRVEVHDSVRRWMQTLSLHWKRGAMLTIDYGATIEGLYQRQPAGSLRAYRAQERLVGEAIYQNVGRQDLTADVNFTDLMEWSKGFAVSEPFVSQAEFLAPFVDPTHGGDRYAIDPWGAGQAFQVWQCVARGEELVVKS